jgi:predicted membrane-bound spermidine synthase
LAPVFALFLIIFLEGYVVLSVELLAIRLLIPFTGSGTDTVSIIIAAVLLPLAVGYYAGGRFRPGANGKSKRYSIRRRLIGNLLISSVFLTIGLSYYFLNWAFDAFQDLSGWHNRILLSALYAAIFVVIPVYLLGQTVPLVSNYFSRDRLSLLAGRMLFFSTIGSFMGAVFGTLVLMALLGVHHTVSITIGCIALLIILLSRRKISPSTVAGMAVLLVAVILNSPWAMSRLNVVSNNQYSTVQIVEYDKLGLRTMELNRTYASVIYKNNRETYASYVAFFEQNFIRPAITAGVKKTVLVLGAGGFSVGRTDTFNTYVYVDIDKELKRVSEDLFLEEKLTENKTFVAMDARAYLLQTQEKFDLVLIDLFRDPISLSESLMSREFFEEVKQHVKEGGIVSANFWASPAFADEYSRNLDYTLRSVYPALNRQTLRPYDAWKRQDDWDNIVYTYVHYPDYTPALYSDMKNKSIYDKPFMLHRKKESQKKN